MSWACFSASFTISVCDASRTACSRASCSSRSHSRLLDLLGDSRAHLVEDVVDLLAVDAHLVGERHGLRLVHEVVELVDQYQYFHELPVYSWSDTGAPTR